MDHIIYHLKEKLPKVHEADLFGIILIFSNLRMNTAYNITVEELEVRVERLAEDMFQAQADIIDNQGLIIDNQGLINSLEFSLQETKETVKFRTI